MSVEMLFSKLPGRRERLLKRQFENPLFGEINIEPFDIQEARRKDSQEVEQFINEFRDIVQQVTELKPSADADVILKLKESLDKIYEQCAGLAGDQAEVREMIKRLLAMMMQSMWKAVGNDAMGISKLEMEEQARQAHFTLLEHAFIADLLAPDSVIDEALMLPSLLSEPSDVVMLAVQLFEPEQQQMVYQQGLELVSRLDAEHERVIQAQLRLQDVASVMSVVNQQAN